MRERSQTLETNDPFNRTSRQLPERAATDIEVREAREMANDMRPLAKTVGRQPHVGE